MEFNMASDKNEVTDTERLFNYVRTEALERWREKTGRIEENEYSNFVDAFECNWQEKHAGDHHNNFFCSLGEFASNIDDILEDERLDDIVLLGLDAGANTDKLYRYYTRILLVAEQIIEDFEKALKVKRDGDWKPTKLKKFINEVIKHRSEGKYHWNQFNDHLPIYFEGIQIDNRHAELLSFESFETNEGEIQIQAILLPPLGTIVDVLVMCYHRLDQKLNNSDFREEFNDRYCSK